MKKLLLLVFVLALSIHTTGQQPTTTKEINKDVLLEAKGTTSKFSDIKSGNTKENGNDCLDAIIVSLPGTLPFSDIYQTTCGKENYYEETCLGSFDGGEDIIYELLVTEDVVVDINLDPLGNTYTGILIDNACPPGETCMDYSTTFGSDPHEFNGVTLTAVGGPYYIMIDTWPTPDCIPEFNLTISQTATPPLNFDLKVFLEGSFNGIDMNTDLHDAVLIPLAQPYNQQPWNYAGTESVVVVPNENVVDWVLMELRKTSGEASTAIPDSIIARQAAFILKDGQIVDLDGISLPEFDITITDNLYVVIWHRNHLPIMTSIPLVETKGTYVYDFTDNITKAYLDGQKEIGAVLYGMIAGDCDGSGMVDMDDKNNKWSIIVGEMGYDVSDLNLDGEINNIDKDDYWSWNVGSESKVPLEITFNCGDQISDIDGNTYNTVLIGDQCWMKENLKTTTYHNGTPIPNVEDGSAQTKLTTGAYVWYFNDTIWKDSFGALYNWFTTVDPNGLCPTGWHVPSNYEWTELTNFIGGTASPHGNELKSCRTENSPLGGGCSTTDPPTWASDGVNWGTDNYGFSGLPGGFGFLGGSFGAIGQVGWWWSSTEYSSDLAWNRHLGYNHGEVGLNEDYKVSCFSVRCLRD